MADGGATEKLKDAVPTDALRDAGQRLLGLLVQRAAEAATDRVTSLSDRLTGVAENGGEGLREALNPDGDRRDGDDDGDSSPGLLSRGFGAVKDKVKDVFGGGGGGGGSGGGKKLKVTVISEDLDVGLPLRTTYDLWTQFSDFPTFMKKVGSVEQASDEKLNWKAQVVWSHRTWEATIVEQVPDSHIVWRSKGAKGHVDGAVTFTGLGPNLTRVLLVLEYHPQGLFERTGNLWRAQGRRARLEFQHFRRHAMSNVLMHQDEVEGWRGEIHDSEVVKTHEEALEEEQRAQQESEDESGEEAYGEDQDEDQDQDGFEDDDEYAAEEGEPVDEDPVDEDYADEADTDEADTDEADTDEADTDEADTDEDYADEDYADEDYADEDYADEADEEADAEPEDREPVTASRSRRGGDA
ncbi:SRPBCC family protein [Pseudonocardia sp. MH-G8]|uniref:SRPBCC family protein n=1 Tax=Pseudonocardia sp. MH-G8 TaxID=1854588 RepID=UPI000BA097C0|nr:SRPBCC family protein [Pseudonocardia sp. MH-G8]OZM79140.1 cyclase [Pseudonocardia sp. MH-G8]